MEATPANTKEWPVRAFFTVEGDDPDAVEEKVAQLLLNAGYENVIAEINWDDLP